MVAYLISPSSLGLLLLLRCRVVNEGLLEGGCTVLDALLVHDDVLTHEAEEASSVRIRVTC